MSDDLNARLAACGILVCRLAEIRVGQPVDPMALLRRINALAHELAHQSFVAGDGKTTGAWRVPFTHRLVYRRYLNTFADPYERLEEALSDASAMLAYCTGMPLRIETMAGGIVHDFQNCDVARDVACVGASAITDGCPIPPAIILSR